MLEGDLLPPLARPLVISILVLAVVMTLVNGMDFTADDLKVEPDGDVVQDGITTTQSFQCEMVTMGHTLVGVVLFGTGLVIGSYVTKRGDTDV